jgi:two-component system chemotaxis response regulator CheB
MAAVGCVTAASRPIRVMVVDDSAVARAVFARILEGCPDIALVGQAAGAPQAVSMLATQPVDVILLDLEMPRQSGLDALPDLLARAAPARVLVVSSSCDAGGEATMRALRLGAADTLPKPDGFLFASDFAARLVDRVRRLVQPGEGGLATTLPPCRAPAASTTPEVVGVAASTGGVHALTMLLGALPPSFTAPILVTQHLPATFTPFFAKQLNEASGRPVRIAANGLQPVRGEIMLAPGDAHLTLVRRSGAVHVRLAEGRSPSGHLPSADPMLASLAQVHGPDAAALVLSGMGRDGAEGAAALAAAGGAVAVQDRASSVVWGMPGAVARRGLAAATLPPAKLARWLAERGTGAGRWR